MYFGRWRTKLVKSFDEGLNLNFAQTWGTKNIFNPNNYPWRNYLPIKILIINSRKKSFLANYYKKSEQCGVITINTNVVPQALETDHVTFFCFILFVIYIYIYILI